MSDMSHLYRAYAAVHSTEVNQELTESRDEISQMDLTQLTESDLVLVAEEIISTFFKEDCEAASVHELVAQTLEEAATGSDSPLRRTKIKRIAEAFDKAFGKVYEKAVDVCEEEFLKYMANKPLVEKWQGRVSHEHGNNKIHEACVAKDRQGVLEGLCHMMADLLEGGDPLDKQWASNRANQKGLKRVETAIKSAQSTKTKSEKEAEARAKRLAKRSEKGGYKGSGTKSINVGVREENIGVPSKIRQEWAEAYTSIYEKKLAAPDHDPVGQEDKDIDNDGDHDKTDKYLLNRRRVIGKAISKKSKKDVKEGTMDIKGFEIPKKERESAADRIRKKTAEKKAALEKKHGRKMDDHPEYPNKKYVDEARKPGESSQDYADRMKKKHSGGKAKVYDPMKDKSFDHDQAEKTRGQSGKFSKEELERIEAIVNSWDEGYQRNPEKGEKEDKKYAPVRGEKTPMPPRGDKRREDFEKWYRQNVR